jgi:hypothetical protein
VAERCGRHSGTRPGAGAGSEPQPGATGGAGADGPGSVLTAPSQRRDRTSRR